MDKSDRVTFKASPMTVKMLADLKGFYNCSTRSKLLDLHLLPEVMCAIYKNPMPNDLSPKQRKAYKRIMVQMSMIDEVAKECLKLQIAEQKKEAKKKTSKTKKRS